MLFVIYKNILPPSIKEPLIRRTFFVGVDSPKQDFLKTTRHSNRKHRHDTREIFHILLQILVSLSILSYFIILCC